MNYSLHPEAQRDLRDAAQFYRESAGVHRSQALLDEFERVVALLLRYPRLGPVWLYGKRRFIMKRFPYAIIYTVVDDELRVLAVSHHSRRPGHWRDRE